MAIISTMYAALEPELNSDEELAGHVCGDCDGITVVPRKISKPYCAHCASTSLSPSPKENWIGEADALRQVAKRDDDNLVAMQCNGCEAWLMSDETSLRQHADAYVESEELGALNCPVCSVTVGFETAGLFGRDMDDEDDGEDAPEDGEIEARRSRGSRFVGEIASDDDDEIEAGSYQALRKDAVRMLKELKRKKRRTPEEDHQIKALEHIVQQAAEEQEADDDGAPAENKGKGGGDKKEELDKVLDRVADKVVDKIKPNDGGTEGQGDGDGKETKDEAPGEDEEGDGQEPETASGDVTEGHDEAPGAPNVKLDGDGEKDQEARLRELAAGLEVMGSAQIPLVHYSKGCVDFVRSGNKLYALMNDEETGNSVLVGTRQVDGDTHQFQQGLTVACGQGPKAVADVLASNGFQMSTVDVAYDRLVMDEIDKRDSVMQKQYAEKMSSIGNVLSQSLGIAACGVHRGFFGGANPIASSLVENLSTKGGLDQHVANELVAAAMDAAGDVYADLLREKTMEIVGKSEDVRNELAETIAMLRSGGESGARPNLFVASQDGQVDPGLEERLTNVMAAAPASAGGSRQVASLTGKSKDVKGSRVKDLMAQSTLFSQRRA